MREILGRRRRLRLRRKEEAARLDAALTCATVWRWPVLPGAGTAPAATHGERGCACPEPDCAVPGAHPFDPGLLAATTDERMVRWWWTNRPTAPVLLATGGRAPCAVSLPAVAGARALSALDALGMRLGPVVATPTRWSLLVAPYTLERLGELLYAKDWVPSSLRFHGEGGYLVLPPSAIGTGQVRWERPPAPTGASASDSVGPGSARRRVRGGAPAAAAPWLPDVEAVLDALVEASTGAPGGGSRLAY
ncbi:bifunctional DNA primase/polymerase [Streptomyces sp. C11-1]|uniref:Bifunctional DNA primase/polymerase n=1 Tax=Streptomyces durocortorensis TaxID=2811104 RepID=A0ABY9VYX2_9ACTN|nr:bifunctional DNA primase/polymerase [Streptomyces durocortorensis]WNF28162.1 bifunctional DNA primase/polymerase [Streptomyces durocortorensis]